ncbi:hypothetical protein IQ06DRAFT_346735 [Phaeosphaeriaceae sp. SRC1lsM3a]|nr:hypothetical protein IQ06DRAFT_346735 [Stagonospora sp. SRC1lsM3a]
MYGKPLPAVLPGPTLSDREAVADACFRAFASIDQCDLELLKSSITDDITTDIASKPCDGAEELITKVWTHVAHNLDTVHYLNNMRIAIDTETTARVSFMAMAVHCKLGDGYDLAPGSKFTTGAVYECEAVKGEQEGFWRLKAMKSNHIWGSGDQGIMKPAGAPE